MIPSPPPGAIRPGVVLWLTGLPSSGKSTLARKIHAQLARRGRASCVLDGDEVRASLVPAPGYTPEARDAFYATLGRLAALLARQGLAVLVPATAHRAAYRAEARALAPAFVEIHVTTPAAECARRDAKGLYAATAAGKASGLPGADLGYEAPEAPEITATGGEDEDAVQRAVALAERSMGEFL
ncbi:MAG: adenylyl-sulfate kinase [Byssovorax sp.]